jgi:hypothetical protein
MRRRTADGIDVCLWDDGGLSGWFGHALPGVRLRRPRTAKARHDALRAGRLLLGDVCMYDVDELGDLYAAAERAKDGLPGTMRRIYRERLDQRYALRLTWTVTSTDREGRPTERVARLPRLRWPDLVVWDFCGGPGSKLGRYVVHRRLPGRGANTTMATGFSFYRISDLLAFLAGQDMEVPREVLP